MRDMKFYEERERDAALRREGQLQMLDAVEKAWNATFRPPWSSARACKIIIAIEVIVIVALIVILIFLSFR